MVTSCVDSGIAGTISMESDLSSYCYPSSANNPSTSGVRYSANAEDIGFCEEAVEEFSQISPLSRMTNSMPTNYSVMSTSTQANVLKMTAKEEFYQEAELLSDLTSGECSGLNVLPDEEFVSKFVLAEQICSTQLSSNPLLHKFSIVPSRHMVFGSYLFTVKKDNEQRLSAFSIVLSSEMADWYLVRQSVIEEFFVDIISRFKAAFLVEDIADLVFRFVTDKNSLQPFGQSYNCVLSDQRHVLGCRTDSDEVLKMMITLSFPYLRLQGIKRTDMKIYS
uniref:Uncharacterized protein n=1 Tax=Ditylenchus dipsaci TaxID=166011 RepID=A0A915D4K5_9BILA